MIMFDFDPPLKSLQTVGVALTLIQANGCSAVDTPVMLVIQLPYNAPLYVNGNEQSTATSVQQNAAKLNSLLLINVHKYKIKLSRVKPISYQNYFSSLSTVKL